MTTILCPGELIDGSGAAPRADRAVRVEADTIAAVGPRAEIVDAAPQHAVVIDAPESTLVPGFVDAHVHLAWGLPAQSNWPDVAPVGDLRFAWALAGAQAALRSGVTTQRDCGAPDLVVVHLRDAIGAGMLAGPHLLACGPCITTTAGHGEFIGVTADSVDDVRRRVRELCSAGVDFIKVMASGGDMDPHTNRYQPQFSDAELNALVADAHRLSLPVVAHCNATSSIRQAVHAGVDTIAHCNWLGDRPGIIDYDGATASMLLERNLAIDLNVDATIRPYRRGDGTAMPDTFTASNRWELHADLRGRGARILLSSDEFGARTARFPELLARAVDELQLDVAEAVHRATAVPAAVVGRDDVGVIAPGMKADLVLLDGHATSSAAVLTRATDVWRNGDHVIHGGRISVIEPDG